MELSHNVASGTRCWLRDLLVLILNASGCVRHSEPRRFSRTTAMFNASYFGREQQQPAASMASRNDMAGDHHHSFGVQGMQVGERDLATQMRWHTVCRHGTVRRTFTRRSLLQSTHGLSVSERVATRISSLGTAIGEVACTKRSLAITRGILANSLY